MYNRTREKAEELSGAAVADSPKEVAENSESLSPCSLTRRRSRRCFSGRWGTRRVGEAT